MKCIKYADGKIKRVPDFQAKMLVEAKIATYVPKSEWKKEREVKK